MSDPEEGEITVPGCLLLRFAQDGRCLDLWDYWQVQPGWYLTALGLLCIDDGELGSTEPGNGPAKGQARRLAMARLNVNNARCEALFASGLQRSPAPTAEAVAQAISCTVRQLGSRGCASQMAQEFGDHPEVAMDRMRWVRQLIGEISPSPAPRRAGRCRPAPGRFWPPSARPARPPRLSSTDIRSC